MRVGFYDSLLIAFSGMTGVKSPLFADHNFYKDVDCTNSSQVLEFQEEHVPRGSVKDLNPGRKDPNRDDDRLNSLGL